MRYQISDLGYSIKDVLKCTGIEKACVYIINYIVTDGKM